MLSSLSSVILIGLFAQPFSALGSDTRQAPHFDAAAAFADTSRATSFGERPPASPALGRLRDWIVASLKRSGAQVSLDAFTAQTPDGAMPMTNIIAKFPGTSGKALVITGHYDTMHKPMLHFVGANDAGSSTGFLTELGRVVPHLRHGDDIYLVFFDGEEAIHEWTDTDSVYGSRHLAGKWGADGTLSRIRALINVDMIGDKDLDINNDENSSRSLRELMWQQADRLGYGKYFVRTAPSAIGDDHVPFIQEGVNALDVIDLDYGPNGGYWHTAQDTIDKLSPKSFQVVGDVILAMIRKLEE